MDKDSKLYKLDELTDQIKESIDNIDKIIAETKELNDVLNKHAKRRFKKFIEEQEGQIKTLQDKKKDLAKKLDNILIIIQSARKDKDKAEFLDLILNTLIQF